jgi:hypothetical protein
MFLALTIFRIAPNRQCTADEVGVCTIRLDCADYPIYDYHVNGTMHCAITLSLQPKSHRGLVMATGHGPQRTDSRSRS